MNHKIEQIKPRDLHFDFKNPRVAEFGFSKLSPENEILEVLWSVMGVEEIVLSIKASGFFSNEPLIAVKEGDKYVVIEGNRRLAAVKAIINPKLADSIGINKNLLRVDPEVQKALDLLPVIFVNSRVDAWKFIGFKHINGPAKWGSYAKAQYISQIKNDFNIPLADIASQIGDTHKTVEKLYQGLKVIEQAEENHLFDRTDIPSNRLYFSHLYTGLTYQSFKEFIGIQQANLDSDNPVPKEKYEELGLLLNWLFGNKKEEQQPLIQSQNPDLRRLEAVLKNKEAIIALKDGVSLITAFEISQPKKDALEHAILEAKRALQKAHSFQSEGFDGLDIPLLKQAGSVADLADELYEIMDRKHQETLQKNVKRKRVTEGD